MTRGLKIILAIILFVVSLPVAGFIGLKYYEKWNYPAPPANAFPEQVGKLKMLGKLASVREDEYIRHEADYQMSDDIMSRIHYYLKIYPSDDLANAVLKAQAEKTDSVYESTTWEDRFDKSGQKVGRMLKESTIRSEGQGTVGFCALTYVKGSALITIVKDFECDPAKEFLQE